MISLLGLTAGILALAWATPALADSCEGPLPSKGQAFSGTVRYVGDGDSLCVGPAGRPDLWIEIRLGDFYAPELHELGGAQAKAMLVAVTVGQRLDCRAGRRGYNRIIAWCRIAGKPVGDLLHARGAVEGGWGHRHAS